MLDGLNGLVLLAADASGAPAAGAGGAGAGGANPQQYAPNPFLWLVPMVLIMVVFFWMSHRAEKKRAKERQDMLDGLKPEDKVVTIGGIYGKVVKVRDDGIVLRVDNDKDVRITVSRGAVGRKVDGEGKEGETSI